MAISWEDHGIVLAVRRLGEHDAIVSLLTENQGRHAGVVKGGSGKTARALLQPGNVVKAAWRGRLDSHIGTYGIEPVHPYAAVAMSTPAVLSGLSALCAMVETALPEPKAKAVKKPAAKKAEAPAAEAEAEAEAKPAKTPRAKKTDE